MVASSRLTFCIVSPVRLITLTSSTMSYWCTAGERRGGGCAAWQVGMAVRGRDECCSQGTMLCSDRGKQGGGW